MATRTAGIRMTTLHQCHPNNPMYRELQ